MSNAIDNNNKQMPTKEEMRLFLKLGRRLHVFENSYYDSKHYYENINAVVTLAFFIEWLYEPENVQAKNSFVAEMNALSDDSLREYIVDKALDYYEECAERDNNNFSRSMVKSNWERVHKERNESKKRCIRRQYWPVMAKSDLKKSWSDILDYQNMIHVQFDKVLGTRKIVYFHGFGSSFLGRTVKSLQELLPEFTVIAKDIYVDPQKALRELKGLCELEQPELVVGTSMGGMYAQQMRGFKRICINPAFDLSQHKDILHEGTFEFLNPRRNGETTFTITPEIISHFEEMEAHQFDGITDEDRENVYGLFADNDTTVNCEEIFRQHYQNVIHFHGEHRLNRQVIEEVLVPLIKEITSKQMPAEKEKLVPLIKKITSKQMPSEEEKLKRPHFTENLRWPLFEEKELETMGWEFLFCKKEWEEVNILLKNGDYDEAEKKTLGFKEKYMDSLMMFDLLLLEAQHRKGDFDACSETYQNTNRPSLAFFSAKDKTPLVLEYCEAMLDLQGTIPAWIQAAWKGAHDCLNSVMRDNPPERSYLICIRAFKAALEIGEPLFGGNEESLIKDYIKSGLSWYPKSKTLLELKSEFN